MNRTSALFGEPSLTKIYRIAASALQVGIMIASPTVELVQEAFGRTFAFLSAVGKSKT
jgi:hypothetical protein